MKIALILENSQAGKNKIIFEELNRAAKAHGHEVLNFGMYTAEDKRCLTYVMNGLLASLVLTCKVADFVVTGCGTGEGACPAKRCRCGSDCQKDAGLFPARQETVTGGGRSGRRGREEGGIRKTLLKVN